MRVTQVKLRELFDYRNDGFLIRKTNITSAKIGDVAGSVNNKGYTMISVNGKRYVGHRLIWIWHYGYDPENDIDHHPDRNKSNNRIENLREATHVCNLRNTGNYKGNTSGVKGVSFNKEREKWHSQITVMNINKYIGCHEDFEDAVFHRYAAEQCLEWDGCDSASPAYLYLKNKGLIN